MASDVLRPLGDGGSAREVLKDMVYGNIQENHRDGKLHPLCHGIDVILYVAVPSPSTKEIKDKDLRPHNTVWERSDGQARKVVGTEDVVSIFKLNRVGVGAVWVGRWCVLPSLLESW
eukprot:2959356-Pyramimonas_sp.AAC.1